MLKYFVILYFCGLSLASVCPPAEKLLPCSCDENRATINCKDIRGFFDIKSLFDRVGPLIPESTVFNKLNIFDTSLLELPENSIQTLKFVSIDMSMNRNLEHIHPNAFNATYSVTTNISLWNNYISNNPPKERDIYKFLSNFKNAQSIWIPGNQISTVPEEAFGSLPELESLYLGSNKIKSIGNNAFSKLPNLKKIYLSVNQIPSNGIAIDAFKSVSKSVNVDLTSNKIEFLDQMDFETLLESVHSITVGGHYCSMTGCSDTRLICDSRADWICKHVEEYKTKLSGYLCNANYDNIWEYCNKKPF